MSRGEAQQSEFLVRAMAALAEAHDLREAGFRDPARAKISDAEYYIEAYIEGPLLAK